MKSGTKVADIFDPPKFEAKILPLEERNVYIGSWYDKVDNSSFTSFNTIAGTIYEHYDEILNYFVNRSTNAFAESFNAKIKAFRAQLRGVTDLKFFLYRLTKLFSGKDRRWQI